MILRKPYAFLIKNFKKIHLIILLLTAFTVYNSGRILSFFNDYVLNKTAFYSSNLADEYIYGYMYILPFLVVIFSSIIYILMKQKEKPRKLYAFMIMLYIVLPILFYADYNYLNIIQIQGLEPRLARIIRDINFISVVFQIPFVISMFVRAVGFDIKKFNFGEDIASLQIDVTDDEEFELTAGINPDKIERKYRNQIRELKYFYAENKSVIIGIIVIVVFSIFGFFFFQNQILNKINKQTDIVNVDNLYFKINGVYSTKLNYRGIDVSEKGYTYLVVSLNANNKSKENRKINIDNLRIVVGENIYGADITKYEYFVDIGNGYYDQQIETNKDKDYIFVYKIKNEDFNSNMILRYADKLSFNKSGLNTRYKRISITPTSLDTITEFHKADLEKEIYYGLSFLKETKLKVNSMEFNDKYEYVNNGIITYINDPVGEKTIMKISYNLTIDPSINYAKTFKDLLTRFGTITYTLDGKSYNLSYLNVTPKGYKGNDVYLSVDKKIMNATNIELVMTIRNKKYTHVLKGTSQ